MDKSPAQAVYLALQTVADPVKAPQMAAYMKDQFPFLGVQTPLRRQVTKEIVSNLKKQTSTISWSFVHDLYQYPYRECHQVALDYLDKVKGRLTYDHVPELLQLASRHQWWDSIDRLDRLIGSIGLEDPRIDTLMLELAQHPNFWMRRLAIDHQISRKEKTKPDLLAQIIYLNFGQKEFFINKAIGWSLREYAKTDPEWVRDFIKQKPKGLSPLSIREASKHL